MADFNCKFPFLVLKRYSFQIKALFLLILCIIEILGKFGLTLQNDPLELKIAIFVLVSQIMVFHFEYKKDFWHILVTFIVCKVSLSSSRSNKKTFPVSRASNWTPVIFLLLSVMIFLNTGF